MQSKKKNNNIINIDDGMCYMELIEYNVNCWMHARIIDDGIPVWLQDVNCARVERCLSSCQECPSSENSSCNHTQDVTIQCSEF